MIKSVSCAVKQMSRLAEKREGVVRESWSVADLRAGSHTAYTTVQLGRCMFDTVDKVSHG
jgi:hypothetical protein